MNTAMGSPAPKWYEPSIYKLYVCPVTGYNKPSLMEEFSQYAEVVDAFVSDPVSNGFQWAFVYFANEEGINEAIRKVEEESKPFRVNRAKPKVFKPASVVAAESTVSAKMLNGIGAVHTNGVSFVTPPNCVFCKRITVKQCISCKNPFCQTECALDGWRMHTSSCIKVAEVIKLSEPNVGVDGNPLAPIANTASPANPIASTVVSFMKDCKSSNKKFSTNEFAEACNFRGKAPATPDMKDESSIDYVPNIPTSPPSKNQYSSNFDKNRKNAASFQKPGVEHSELDGLPPAPNDKSINRVPFKKNKNTENKDRGNRRSFQNSAPQKPPNHNDRTNANIESKEDWNLDFKDQKRAPQPRKSTPKYAENEEIEANTYDGPGSKQSFHKQDRRDSVSKDTASVHNGHSNESEKRVAFKPKSTNEQPKRPIRSQEPKINTAPETDLKLKEGDAVRVMVTSVQNENTFYVANSQKIIEVLRQIVEIAGDAPELNNVELNSKCLAFFDGDWYRARIINTNPIQVEYIDYGNREFCEMDSLKMMPELLTKYLPLASRVRLHDGSIAQSNIKENEEVDIYIRMYDAPSDSWIIDAL